MMRTCERGDDCFETLRDMRASVGVTVVPCGKTYDDLNHRTICPHEPVDVAIIIAAKKTTTLPKEKDDSDHQRTADN